MVYTVTHTYVTALATTISFTKNLKVLHLTFEYNTSAKTIAYTTQNGQSRDKNAFSFF